MKESESRRAAIVQRLLRLNISANKELQDIVKLTAVVCKTPIALITLLDDEKQHMAIKIGTDVDSTPVEESFCNYAIMQQGIMEVQDTLMDQRFVNHPHVSGCTAVRFYAGSPLVMQNGESLGTLCVADVKPNALSDDQKQMLQILSRQVTNILEFEMNLKQLNEDIAKVQESELKLKAIFQNSPVTHILVDKEMQVLAFNNAAACNILLLNKKVVREGIPLASVVSVKAADLIAKHFTTVIGGKQVCIEQKINYGITGTYWWEIELNPAYDGKEEIMGVSLNVTNVTTRIKDRENIVAQNKALKEIAQLQSHEIRRPVANILGLLDVLSTPEMEDYDRCLQYLKMEAVALDKKIRQIVEITNKKLKADHYDECI